MRHRLKVSLLALQLLSGCASEEPAPTRPAKSSEAVPVPAVEELIVDAGELPTKVTARGPSADQTMGSVFASLQAEDGTSADQAWDPTMVTLPRDQFGDRELFEEPWRVLSFHPMTREFRSERVPPGEYLFEVTSRVTRETWASSSFRVEAGHSLLITVLCAPNGKRKAMSVPPK
jgi:hypothetical protein